MAEDQPDGIGVEARRLGGIPLRAFAPNAITALALCFGLTGVRFAIGEEWDKALAAIIFAGVLDGMDGRIARLLRAQSRFGAELDSLSSVSSDQDVQYAKDLSSLRMLIMRRQFHSS